MDLKRLKTFHNSQLEILASIAGVSDNSHHDSEG